MLAYVHDRLNPADVPVSLVGDTEFEVVDVQIQVAGWGWHYVVRQNTE